MFAPTPTPGSAAGSAAAAPAGPAASLPPAIPRPFEGNRGYQQSSDMAGWRDKGFSGAINKLMGSKKPAMGGLVSDAARGNDIPLTERPPSGRLYSGDARVRPSPRPVSVSIPPSGSSKAAMTTPSSVAIPNKARNPTQTATLKLTV